MATDPNNSLKLTFPKEERLHSKKMIQELFEKGSSFYLYPFKIIYLKSQETTGANQVLISVAKRNFKKAVDRNLVKRRVREAYRLHKHRLNFSQKNKSPLLIAYLYTAKEIHPFHFIENKLIKSLTRLIDKNT